MKIHKEGFLPILVAIGIFTLNILLFAFFTYFFILFILISLVLLGSLFLVIRFFRVPNRKINIVPNGIISPADGTIIAIERCFEQEFFKDERLKISIFMSIFNVHVNYYPIDGEIVYVGYHPGKFLIAKLPKASLDNEHNTVVVQKSEKEIVLFRQIAGCVARRIVSYAQVNQHAKQGKEMGIIRFGSRVDVYLPLDAQVFVNNGDKVRARKTLLATF